MSKCKVIYNKDTRLYQVTKEDISSMPCASIREAKESWKILKALHGAVFTVEKGNLIMNVKGLERWLIYS